MNTRVGKRDNRKNTGEQSKKAKEVGKEKGYREEVH
jgi:hypothetical protein